MMILIVNIYKENSIGNELAINSFNNKGCKDFCNNMKVILTSMKNYWRDEFDEEFRSSFIRNKLTIDTSNSTVKESLQEFVTNIGPFLSDRDRLRIQANQILKS